MKPVIDIIPLIKFNQTVCKIQYNQPNALIEVECEDGSAFLADHVICTVSLGVLKEKHWNLFEPLLSQEKINSIDGMMIGTIDKIYLEFDKPFWNNHWDFSMLLWRKEEIKAMRDDRVHGDWLCGLSSFTRPNPLQPNIVCGWISGTAAQMMEQKTDVEVKAGAEKCLRLFLKQYDIPDAKTMARSVFTVVLSNENFE